MGSTENTASSNVAKNLQSNSATPDRSALSAPVGIGAANHPDDVHKVSSALSANGLMDAPQRHADSTLFSGIIAGQERMGASLKRDGLVNPGGPTEGAFARLTGQGFVKQAQPAQPATPSQPEAPATVAPITTGNATLNAQITAQSKQAAVKQAEARARLTAGDVTRTGFQQMQDVNRVRNAREDADRAAARASDLENRRRERDRQDQLQAMQKANAEAAGHAAKAKQAARSGLKNLTSQAGAALGAIVPKASPARHPGQAAEAARPGTHFNPDPSVRVNDGSRIQSLRDGSGMTGLDERMFSPLPDETISSNQRLSTALSKRRGVGDLPRFTTDAINSDPNKAIPEFMNLFDQVRKSDPEQADELFVQTIQGIAPEYRDQLNRLWPEMTDSTNIDTSDDKMPPPEFRTKEMRPEDKANIQWMSDDVTNHENPNKPEVTKRAAQAGSESDDTWSLSVSKSDLDDLKSPDDLMLEPGAKYRDPDEWSGNIGQTAGDLAGAAADVSKAAWTNATGSPQEVKGNLSNLSKEYRAKGYTRAADNLDYFLNGKGAAKTIPRDEARKDPFIANAEQENRKRFETSTFLGKTSNEDANRQLSNLKDGETIKHDDKWDVVRKTGKAVDDLTSIDRDSRDDALAEGRKDFTSKARFTATRSGDLIYIHGNVNHDGSERYDFEAGDLGDIMGAKGLVEAGLAHEFDTIRQWGQTFEGTVDVSPGKNGNVLSNPQFKWQDTWKDKNPNNH